MNGFAGDGRRRVGNASLLNATADDIGRDLGSDLSRTRAWCVSEACAAKLVTLKAQ